MRVASTPTERLRRAVTACEAAVRYLAIIRLASDGAHPLTIGDLRGLRAPSFGTWLQHPSCDRGEPLETGSDLLWAAVERVVRLRNDLHHGMQPTDTAAQRDLDWLSPLVAQLARSGGGNSVISPKTLSYSNGSFGVQAIAIHGHSPALKVTKISWPEPLETGAAPGSPKSPDKTA